MNHARPTPHGRTTPRGATFITVAAALLVAAACWPWAARAGYGTTLASYRTRVRWSAVALDAAASQGSPDAGGRVAGTPSPAAEASSLAVEQVRANLPPREQVEWFGGYVEVDNSWLHEALDAYERERDARKRAPALARLAERLSALSDRLAELEEAMRGARPRDKEAEKGRLAAILRRQEFDRAAEGKSAWERLRERLAQLVRDLFPGVRPLAPGQTPGLTRAAQVFVYVLAGLLVAFVLWRFGPRAWRHARLRVTPEAEGARVVLGEVLAPEQGSAELLAQAEQLARAGDWRGAIRPAYLALLCELGDRGVVGLARHKTNRDYLEAVRRARADLYTEVRPLTAGYERHWYGTAAATPQDWEDFRARYKKAVSV